MHCNTGYKIILLCVGGLLSQGQRGSVLTLYLSVWKQSVSSLACQSHPVCDAPTAPNILISSPCCIQNHL